MALLWLAFPARAESPLPQVERLKSSPVLRHLVANPLGRAPDTEADRTLGQMYVPPGFQVELVAAEPAVRQPVAFAWDARGRLWIAEAHSYPSKRAEGEGLDQIVILADADGDGRFETRSVFAEHLNLVSGFELGFGGVWVGAAPELLFIPDRNGDDRPDGPPEVLLNGFGYQDTHECLNSFHWGPDGWLYGIQGVFNLARIGKPGATDEARQELRAGVWRYHPTRHEFEIFAHGGSNPWGLDHDESGQLFMTHCRSYWGRGGTTHVIQGGHFWNQANANYAPFIVANPPAAFPTFRNYLLASARYDHGAGGAGEPGSDAIYGGHSHVGTLIYLGDNWPESFRGRLLTHNLHGHQINQQIHHPLGSGFDTVHAGQDLFFCSDPKYVAIDLQTGPDGAVYSIDWYDQQHCHNPNNDRWERGSGRVYRMQFAASYRPVRVDLTRNSDSELTELLGHKNSWHARMAQRLLQERAAQRKLEPAAVASLRRLRTSTDLPARQLQALWASHATGNLGEEALLEALSDRAPYVRAWAVQFSAERRTVSAPLRERLVQLATSDASPVVRRHLASAAQRLPDAVAWPLLEALALHGEDATDRNLPFLLWHALAPRVPAQLDRAWRLASGSAIPVLGDWVHWYAATLDGEGVERAVAALSGLSQDVLHRRLAGLWLALEPRARVPMPASWRSLGPGLLTHDSAAVRRLAESVAGVFGDATPLPALRATLDGRQNAPEDRRHAFEVLARTAAPDSLPSFLALLDDPDFRRRTLDLLARYDSPEIPRALLQRIAAFSAEDRNAALNTLSRRASFALALLDAIGAGTVKRDQMSAFHIRQLTELKHPGVDQRVTSTWGRIQPSPAEKAALMSSLEKTFNEAPLWAYDGRAGRELFLKACASCHVLGKDGVRIGPELTGAGKNGIRYYLENIIDPNAVVGTDFQMTTVETRSGDVISGLLIHENPTAITLRTLSQEQVLAKSDLASRSLSTMSLMPEGLLEALAPREQIELLKYLVEH